MANFLLLISLLAFGDLSFAQFNVVRRFPLKVTQVPITMPGAGVELMTHTLLTNMPRYILSASFGRSDLTSAEKKILAEIRTLLEKNGQEIKIFFAENSEALFAEANNATKDYLEAHGFSRSRPLFELQEYATHRLVVTGQSPGPIIFNRASFRSMSESPDVTILLGYLIHELAHQTGKGFEAEADLDRLSQKVSEHVQLLGGQAVEPSISGFRLWADNFLSVEAVKKVSFSQIENNNFGQLWMFSDSHTVRLTASIFAAIPDWTLLHPELKHLAYLGIGAPYFAEIREFSDYPRAQSVRGSLSLLVTDDRGRYLQLKGQYELLIPFAPDESGGWKYSGQPIITNINNLMLEAESVLTPGGHFSVERAEYLQSPRRVEFEILCPEAPKELHAWTLKELPVKSRSVDIDVEEFIELELVRTNGNRCLYTMDIEASPGSDPTLSFKVLGLRLLTKTGQESLLPLPLPIDVQLVGQDFTPPLSQLIIKDVAMIWARPDGNDSWHNIESIPLQTALEGDQVAQSPLDILISGELSWGDHAYCGATITLEGPSKKFPKEVDTLYISETFPQENSEFLASSPILKNSFTELGANQIRFDLVLNKSVLSKHFKTFRVSHLSVRSCLSGPRYFDIAPKGTGRASFR